MNKQVLDVQQMQHLQELGLELDYDTLYSYVKFEDTDWLLKPSPDLSIIGVSCKYIPAYTLQDVLDAMTRWEINDGFCPRITIDLSERLIRYHFKDKERVGMVMKSFDGNGTGSLIDADYEMLCWSIGKKFIKTNKKK